MTPRHDGSRKILMGQNGLRQVFCRKITNHAEVVMKFRSHNEVRIDPEQGVKEKQEFAQKKRFSCVCASDIP